MVPSLTKAFIIKNILYILARGNRHHSGVSSGLLSGIADMHSHGVLGVAVAPGKARVSCRFQGCNRRRLRLR
jgi:hypothetical protein